jgi:4-amino-4-deoxy-L-arabinose transferase-like glycosyltransferase
MKREFWVSISIFLGALILFVPFLGAAHLFDWDELNFAEAAREMLLTGEFSAVQINFQNFYEKPPLFFWMQALSMSVFGVNEFAARLPNAICGAFTLSVIWNIGKRWFDERMAWWWVLTHLGALLPVFYFKSGIIDPWFNLFIFLGIYYGVRFTSKYQERKSHVIMLCAFFLALALLTKGPVGLLVFLLVSAVYFIIKRFYGFPRLGQVLLFLAVFLFTGGSWFLFHVFTGTPEVVQEFINVQVSLFSSDVAGHAQPFWYHFAVLLIGCFPISIFALPAMLRMRLASYERDHFHLWMKIMFWVVLILFSIVKTKIVHYSSLTYFPLTFLAALTLYRFELRAKRLHPGLFVLGLVLSVLLGAVYSALPWIKNWTNRVNWSEVDVFTAAQFTQEVEWPEITRWIGPLFVLLSVASLIGLLRGKIYWAKIQLGGGLLVSMALILLVTPKAEIYFQRPAIEFYKRAAEEKAYVHTLGMKSYGYLFYGQKEGAIPKPADQSEQEWLTDGPVDRTVYFVGRNNRRNKVLERYPNLRFVEERGGYDLYVRPHNTQPLE